MLQYAPDLQTDGFIVLRGVDGCWQLCNDSRAKVSVDRRPQSKRRVLPLITATFGTHMDVDATVVGAAAEVWHKGPTRPEVKPYCHKVAPSPSHCAGAVTTPVIMFCTSLKCTFQLVSGLATASQTPSSVRESRITQTQETGH